jgi:hypothetical protein
VGVRLLRHCAAAPGVVNYQISNGKIRPQRKFSPFSSACSAFELKWATESESQVFFVSISYFGTGGSLVNRSELMQKYFDPK